MQSEDAHWYQVLVFLNLLLHAQPTSPSRPTPSSAAVEGSGTTLSMRSLFWTESEAGRPSIEPLRLLPRPLIDLALTSI